MALQSAEEQRTWTFVFTDIVDSTPLWETSPDLMMEQLEVHNRILDQAIEANGGRVFSTMGDGLVAAFVEPTAAVAAMVDAQAVLATTPWPEGCVIRVRMGANTGPARERDGDFFGPTLNLAARVMDAGHGGQILVSEATAAGLDELTAAGADDGGGISLQPLGAHRLKGVAGHTGLVMVLSDGQPRSFPPLRVLDPGRFTIPVPANSIVGREGDIAAVLDGIGSRRCTTIWATGGAGKTRLAIEVATKAGDRFPAGVHVIELADLEVIDDLTTRVAELALGTEATAGPDDHLRRLATELSEPVLIVVDNAEHLIDDCAKAIETLLRATAMLTFLVTSREPLRIDGEHAYPLEPLGTTENGPGRSAAARLFIERATAAAPTSELDLEAVDEIVERLDGLPLALELAAANLATMGTKELRTHLDRVLAQAPTRRGAGSRHRTVETAIGWSAERCTPDEKRLLARLSVFPGSFDLEAITAICTDDQLESFEVIGLLAGLVERSLVSSFDGTGGRRYRLLRLIRQYAMKLPGELDNLDDRHADHYLDVARRDASSLHRDASPTVGAALSEEHDNFVAILERGVNNHDHITPARRLATRLQPYWEDTGRLRIGADWLARLNEPQAIGDLPWARVVLVGATYDAMCGLTPLGRQPVEAIRSFADMGVPGAHAMQMPLAFIDLSRGHIPEAIERFDKAAGGFTEDPTAGWQALMTAGALGDYHGDTRLAAGFYERADAIDTEALPGWVGPYREIFVTGSLLNGLSNIGTGAGSPADGPAADGPAAAEQLVERLTNALDELVATGLQTRITIAGHGAMWALERADRLDLVAERLVAMLAYPRRTGYLWFSLALADLAAHMAIRQGAIDLGLRLEAAVDARLQAAEYGFPSSFNHRRNHPARTEVPAEAAAPHRAVDQGLTVADIDELAAQAAACWR